MMNDLQKINKLAYDIVLLEEKKKKLCINYARNNGKFKINDTVIFKHHTSGKEKTGKIINSIYDSSYNTIYYTIRITNKNGTINLKHKYLSQSISEKNIIKVK